MCLVCSRHRRLRKGPARAHARLPARRRGRGARLVAVRYVREYGGGQAFQPPPPADRMPSPRPRQSGSPRLAVFSVELRFIVLALRCAHEAHVCTRMHRMACSCARFSHTESRKRRGTADCCAAQYHCELNRLLLPIFYR